MPILNDRFPEGKEVVATKIKLKLLVQVEENPDTLLCDS